MRVTRRDPASLPDDELVRGFAARHHELDTILQVVRDNSGPTNQHLLVLAPPGFGKSTLARRAAIAVQRDPGLHQRWLPIVFSGDSYEIGSVGELWLEALLHLGSATGEGRWREAWEELRKERDDQRLAARARGALLDLADERGARLLLIVERLDRILGEGAISMDDAWSLRGTLLHDPRVMLLGTAAHRFAGIDRPDQPMFGLLRLLELSPLDARECDRVWTSIAGEPLGTRRAKAARILSGGSPRLVATLAERSRGRGLRELPSALDGLLDDRTEVFRQDIEALSAQLRRVFLALAELWQPSPARAIAERARLPINETSASLARLVRQGRVSIARTQGKNHYYQLSERLYSLYYASRRRGRSEARLRALVSFIQHFFDPAPQPSALFTLPLDGGERGAEPAAENLLAIERFARSLSEAPGGPDLQQLIRLGMRLAAAGRAVEAMNLLGDPPISASIEPLLVALRLRLGETVDAPVEVQEVAVEVSRRIEALREAGDLWRMDPLALVLPDEAEYTRGTSDTVASLVAEP